MNSSRFSARTERFSRPVDIAPLVYTRIIFGAVLFWETLRYFSYGWIEKYFILPQFLPKYFGFEWVQALPGSGMYIVFTLMGVCALGILFGLYYRAAAIGFFLLFTYIFLLDSTRYLNHLYLVSLFSFILIFLPANRAASLDALFWPKLRSNSVPIWTLWALRFQLAMPYFFGGIAKLSHDWLHAVPLQSWIASKTSVPVLGWFVTQEWFAYLLAYGGLVLDLTIVPLLLIRRTRPYAFAVAVMFHLTNAILFHIGIFPWLMLGMTAIYFPPEAFRTLLTKLRFLKPIPTNKPSKAAPIPTPIPTWGIALAVVFVSVQILVPLRHFLYPGDVNWTEEGHRFSWQMMLHEKNATFDFKASDKDSSWIIEPEAYIADHQIDRLATRPDLLLQAAHYVADDLTRAGHQNVRVSIRDSASLNGREYQLLIDSTVDLAHTSASLLPARWIVPLTKPLRLEESKGGKETQD